MSAKRNKRISDVARMALKEQELTEIKSEAQDIQEAVQFYIATCGYKCLGLSVSVESLVDVEKAYRFFMSRKNSLPADLPFELFARLVGIFLGEVIVRSRDGHWCVYRGRHHTLNGIVVNVGSGYCDPLLYGMHLHEAKAVRGADDSTSLYLFATNLDLVFS